MHEIWKIDLNKTVDGAAQQRVKGIPVYALRFSPDGQQVAAALTWYLPGGKIVSNLIVMQTQHPNDNIRKFDIQGIANDYLSTLPAITWSPSADGITAGDTVIRLDEGRTCELTDNREHGFIRADRIVASSFPTAPEKIAGGIGPTKFDIFDGNVHLRDSWELARGIKVADISADRGLFYARVTGFPRATEDLVIDYMAKATVRSSPFWGGNARFVNSGRTICSGRSADYPLARPPEKRPVRCFDVDTGATIGEANNINGGEPIFGAANASRIIAHDLRPARIPFTGGEYGTILKRRVVWDFQTNTEIVSWVPPTQTFDFYLKTGPPKQIKEPFRVAISPDGEYIAEGGNGLVRMYRIQR